MNPVWNEVWHVKNVSLFSFCPVLSQYWLSKVPKSCQLKVKLWDKDEQAFQDDYIGSFETTVEPQGLRELKITGRMGRDHGMFFMTVSLSDPARDWVD